MLLPCCYLAPVSHYSALFRAEGEVRIEVCDHFTKQTLRNRCWIDSPQGALSLTIPIVKASGKTAMRDIRISDHGNWRHQHWAALESSYRQTPFFEYYADDFAPFYEKRWEFLADFNEDLMQLVLSLLDIERPLSRTTTYKGDALSLLLPFEARPYYQMFAGKHGFLPDLSIADLLFNLGPEGVLWL